MQARLTAEVVVAIVYVVSMFLNIMDSTIVNVALPAISREFDVPVHATDGVVVAYLISVAIWIPAAGWVGDRFGTKRTFLLALLIFTSASAACGLAANLSQLVTFRVIQGIGGGMLTPVGMAMLFRTFPPRRRARASQILIVPTVIAPAIGPVLGGVLVDQLSWRWAFYVNVPIGILATIFGAAYLLEYVDASVGPFDFIGFVLAAVSSGLALFVLSEGPALGWTDPLVLVGIVGACVGFALLVRFELARPAPLVDFRLFRNRLFAATNLVSFSGSAGFLGLLFVVPLFLQTLVQVPAAVSGLTTFPEAVGVLAGTQVAGRAYRRYGPRRLLMSGLSFAAVWTASMVLLGPDPDLWIVRAQMFLVGFGMAFSFLSLQAASFAQIDARETGRASALFSAQRQMGAAFGVAVVATVLASASPGLTAFHAAFGMAAAILVIAVLVASRIHDAAAAATFAGVAGGGS
ncbi:MAG: DHA2 family efflux MFS transporter permease subunit [Chloroflexi bacterium]|nr:DHA2 family efflux MFS transporter permease subunit [Chloroflexota bacterium]